MKILHIWDVAGVAYVLAKYQRKDGHHVKVYMRKIFDLFEIGKFYDEPQITCGAFRFIINSIFMARHYDIIHVHSIWKTVPLIKILFRKKIILHYHGTELSTKHKLKRWIAEKCADVVVVSTPDLLQHSTAISSLYVPNPVDIEHFNIKKIDNVKKNNSMLQIHQTFRGKNPIPKFLKDNEINLDITCVNYKRRNVKYHDMPKYLAQYSGFIDIFIFDGVLQHTNSLTGLQAMTMNVPTLCSDLKWKSALLEKHSPNQVLDT